MVSKVLDASLDFYFETVQITKSEVEKKHIRV